MTKDHETFQKFMDAAADVPCKGCTACCRNEQIRVRPEDGDVIEAYLTEDAVSDTTGQLVKILQQKENGDCIYLGETGCTIYDRRPKLCRFFDCRVHYLSMTRAMRERNPQDQKITEGKKRLGTRWFIAALSFIWNRRLRPKKKPPCGHIWIPCAMPRSRSASRHHHHQPTKKGLICTT